MKRELLEKLRWDRTGPGDWELEVREEDGREVRRAVLRSRKTGETFEVRDGILNMLGDLPAEVRREKEHAESFDYLEIDGEKHRISAETIDRYRHLFLSLPAGDGSAVFRPGGSFDNQAGNAERFFKTLELLRLREGEEVLEVGASFGWASRNFALRGCCVTALDVTDYARAADLYFEEDGCYFDRVMADMSRLPFADGAFDLIFSHSVIHHCKDLATLFREFRRVLRPGGRVVALHECSFGIFEDRSGKALEEAIREGFNENAYTISQWKRGAREGGFRKTGVHFFSFIDDYLYRKKLRGAKRNAKIRLAEWIKARPALDRVLNLLSIPYRILFRPKAWMLIAQ
ncbi:MAG: class I SAM-dependent methyltransferase [Candidatus Omnitrophota bacterium]